MADHRTEVPQLIQSIPSIGAIFLALANKDVQWWAAFGGLVFILLQIGYVAWKWRRDVRREEREERERKGQADDE